MSASNSNIESSANDNQDTHEQYTSFDSKYNRPTPSTKWILIDFVLFLVVLVPIVALYFAGQPYKRGFYCDDNSINKPFKESTVSNIVAALVGLSLPGVSFIIVELFTFYLRIQKVGHAKAVVGRTMYVGPIKLNYVALKILRIISVFLFGAAVTVLITDVGKYGVGRLRPHFISVCKPNVNLLNCTGMFITDDVCTGSDAVLIRQARLSFPSGHSSFAAYTMMFLVLYFQARISVTSSLFLKPLLQLTAITLALLCGISRISDYKHHWSDVLAGLLLGILVAVAFVWHGLDWFREKATNTKQEKVLKAVV